MKHRLKGLLALVLSLVMVFALATNAWAAVSIGGQELASGVAFSGAQGTATYNDATSTLTLENFINCSEIAIGNECTHGIDSHIGISAAYPLTINLIGSNTVVDNASATSGGAAVVVTGDLTITSENDGSLNASSVNNNGISANNITIDGANVSVGCNIGLNATGGIINIMKNSNVAIDADGKAIDCASLNLNDDVNNGGSLWYQWTTTNGGTPNTSKLTYNGEKYLKIEPITYTVKFDANGGSGTMNPVTVDAGDYTLPANGFNEPVGDEFFGWSVDPDGAERKLPGDTMQITRDTTVYAIWKYATLGNQGGGYPGTPQPPSGYYPIAPTTPEPEGDKVTSSKTFDGGIASAVVVTILSATGGAWLAKKKD